MKFPRNKRNFLSILKLGLFRKGKSREVWKIIIPEKVSLGRSHFQRVLCPRIAHISVTCAQGIHKTLMAGQGCSSGVDCLPFYNAQSPEFDPQHFTNWFWWHILVIPSVRVQGLEKPEFKVTLPTWQVQGQPVLSETQSQRKARVR